MDFLFHICHEIKASLCRGYTRRLILKLMRMMLSNIFLSVIDLFISKGVVTQWVPPSAPTQLTHTVVHASQRNCRMFKP